MTQININIQPDSMYKKFKRKCLDEDITIKDKINKLIKKEVK